MSPDGLMARHHLDHRIRQTRQRRLLSPVFQDLHQSEKKISNSLGEQAGRGGTDGEAISPKGFHLKTEGFQLILMLTHLRDLLRLQLHNFRNQKPLDLHVPTLPLPAKTLVKNPLVGRMLVKDVKTPGTFKQKECLVNLP